LNQNSLWNGKSKELETNELRESSMVVKVTISAAEPRSAKNLKSQVQEELLRFLIGLRGDVLLGAISEAPAPNGDENIPPSKPEERLSDLKDSSAILAPKDIPVAPREVRISEKGVSA
jgi:hypothetical protein